MARVQYITIAELNEILGVDTYTNDDLIKVYEASELLEYHLNDNYNDYTTSNAPTNLKLATAYQVLYSENGIDEDYGGNAFTIGKYSESNTQENGEWAKVSPKSRRYLNGLTKRVI